MDILKNFPSPKIDFKRDIIRTKSWFLYGKCWLANKMTHQADVRLSKLVIVVTTAAPALFILAQ